MKKKTMNISSSKHEHEHEHEPRIKERKSVPAMNIKIKHKKIEHNPNLKTIKSIKKNRKIGLLCVNNTYLGAAEKMKENRRSCRREEEGEGLNRTKERKGRRRGSDEWRRKSGKWEMFSN